MAEVLLFNTFLVAELYFVKKTAVVKKTNINSLKELTHDKFESL